MSPASVQHNEFDFLRRDTDSQPNAVERRPKMQWVTVVALLGGLAACVGIMNELVYWRLRDEIRAKQVVFSDGILASVRAHESERLMQYRWVHRSEGIVRIPLECAKRLVLDEYGRSEAQATGTQAPPGSSSLSGANESNGTSLRREHTSLP